MAKHARTEKKLSRLTPVLIAAADSALAAKGWQKVDSGGDAAVSAFGRATERDTLETFYDGFPGWGWRGWGGDTNICSRKATGRFSLRKDDKYEEYRGIWNLKE